MHIYDFNSFLLLTNSYKYIPILSFTLAAEYASFGSYIYSNLVHSQSIDAYCFRILPSGAALSISGITRERSSA